MNVLVKLRNQGFHGLGVCLAMATLSVYVSSFGWMITLISGLDQNVDGYHFFTVARYAIALMVMRLRLEERFLRRELPEYTAYTDRVRFRLIPGIW